MNGRVGIFAIDPGTTTGINYGVWPMGVSVVEALKLTERRSIELKGDLLSQAREASLLWRQFFRSSCEVDCVEVERMFMVIESYYQRPSIHGQTAEALDAVKLAHLIIGYRNGQAQLFEELGFGKVGMGQIVWQMPSEAKGYASDTRLRNWGAWIPGPDHKRDALRHAIRWWAKLNGI